MQLAKVSGTVHVDELLDEMTPEEFAEWKLLDHVYPLDGAQRSLAHIEWMLYGYLHGKDATAEAPDFMPWLKYVPEEQPQNEAAIQLISSLLGG